MKSALVSIAVAFLLFARFAAADTAPSHAFDLAVIDARGPVARDSSEVQRFQFLLAFLSRTCAMSEEQIADTTVTMKDIVREKHGCTVKNIDLLNNVYAALKDHPAGTMSFKDALSAVALLICMDPSLK